MKKRALLSAAVLAGSLAAAQPYQWPENYAPTATPGGNVNETLFGDAPVILSEFGGVRFAGKNAGAGWGYQQVESEEALLELYRALVAAASAPGLAGFCYTQFADTFQEQNGLLYGDRTPKVALEKLYEATAQRR